MLQVRPSVLLGILLNCFTVFNGLFSNQVMCPFTADCAGPSASDPPKPKEVPRRQYTVVLDLNGVLLYRTYHRNKLHVERRPGVATFLNWLRSKAQVAFWSSVTPNNMARLLDDLLADCCFGRRDVLCLAQGTCTKSTYRAPTAPEKPFFLKEIETFARLASLSSLENILLIDDSPEKNLRNDPHSAVFPEPYRGSKNDNYLRQHLMPWLDGLFCSNQAVQVYVEKNPLVGGQSPMDPLSREGFLILQGTMQP